MGLESLAYVNVEHYCADDDFGQGNQNPTL